MSWQETLRELNINPDPVTRSLDAAVDNPERETEIGQVRKEFAKKSPRVRAELQPLEIPWEGAISLCVRFDPDDVADERVGFLKLNDVELDVVHQSPALSTRTLEGRPQVEWVIQARPKNPESIQLLRRSSSYSLEGRLGSHRMFTAFSQA